MEEKFNIAFLAESRKFAENLFPRIFLLFMGEVFMGDEHLPPLRIFWFLTSFFKTQKTCFASVIKIISDIFGRLVGDSVLFMPTLASTIIVWCFVLLVSLLTLVNKFWFRCRFNFRCLLSDFSKKLKASRKLFFAVRGLSSS